MSEDTALRNHSYLFLPFIFNGSEDFSQFIRTFENSADWTPQTNACLYMFRYISDKLNSSNADRLCFHYTLSATGLERLGFSQQIWETSSAFYGGQATFSFQIRNIHLFCFQTRVCIAAVEIVSEYPDAVSISSLQFCLKNAATAKLSPADIPDSKKVSPLELLKRALKDTVPLGQIDFCFFSEESSLRTNVLSYTELDESADPKKALFYLRRCYNETYAYQENEMREREEIWSAASNISWGITAEAVACAVTVTDANRSFIDSIFYGNFKTRYLFIYTLLLHQKYVLYRFLTRIGRGTHNNLGMLEQYRAELYDFETDYMFSRITEIPQYQEFYEQISRAFSLDALYTDVHEPIQELSELRTTSHSRKLNLALTALSLLSCFSALADGFAFIDMGKALLPFGVLLGVKIAYAVLVAAILIAVLYNLFSRSKK